MLTRRAFIAAPLPLMLPRALHAAGDAFDTDVIVIGAGAAGLAAAHELRRLKRRAVVLEARGRVGGRIFTDRSLGAPYDAGAFYLHWAEANPLTRIAREAGIKTLDEEEVPRPSRSFDFGEPGATPDALAAWSRLRDRLDGGRGPKRDLSFLDFAGGPDAPAAEGARVMARLALGEEAERVSVHDYMRLRAGDDRLVPDGMGTILEHHARGLDIRLDAPASVIDWSGRGVRVSTPSGAMTARAVIVTASVGVLKSEAIRFTPALPALNKNGLDGLAMGASTRMALAFDGARFGLAPGTNVRVRLSERKSYSFGCFAWDRDIVTVYFGGDHAREVTAMGETEACAHVLGVLASALGEDVRKHYRTGKMHGWWSDPFARGGYSHALPGRADARRELATPVGGRVFFAGEATGGAGGTSGAAITAGGAYLAGVAAARKAAKAG